MAPLFVRLEVTWADHPKIIRAGLDGRGLHATALCLSKRLETDGWIDRTLLYREGADDALIDRIVEIGLLDAEGARVRPAGWHDRNPSQGAIDATRTAKADAAQRGNHKRWQHPGPFADCEKCQVSRTSDRTPIAPRSPDTETDTETENPSSSQGYSTTGASEHSTEGDAGEPLGDHVPPVDEQRVRATAVAVGAAIAAGRSDVGNPTGYAATVTRGILDPNGDRLDYGRIVRLLGKGQTPEQIAEGWRSAAVVPSPMAALAGHGQTQARPGLSPSVVDQIRAQVDEVAAPAARADHLAAARAKRVAS